MYKYEKVFIAKFITNLLKFVKKMFVEWKTISKWEVSNTHDVED
jgi:hypothetical protein